MSPQHPHHSWDIMPGYCTDDHQAEGCKANIEHLGEQRAPVFNLSCQGQRGTGGQCILANSRCQYSMCQRRCRRPVV